MAKAAISAFHSGLPGTATLPKPRSSRMYATSSPHWNASSRESFPTAANETIHFSSWIVPDTFLIVLIHFSMKALLALLIFSDLVLSEARVCFVFAICAAGNRSLPPSRSGSLSILTNSSFLMTCCVSPVGCPSLFLIVSVDR